MACIAVTTGGPYCKYWLSLAEGSVFLISAYLVSTFYSVGTTIGADFFFSVAASNFFFCSFDMDDINSFNLGEIS